MACFALFHDKTAQYINNQVLEITQVINRVNTSDAVLWLLIYIECLYLRLHHANVLLFRGLDAHNQLKDLQ